MILSGCEKLHTLLIVNFWLQSSIKKTLAWARNMPKQGGPEGDQVNHFENQRRLRIL
jgi:hypothetical protein